MNVATAAFFWGIWFMNLVIMFVSPRDIREKGVRRELRRSPGDPTMYRHILSPLVAFTVSNPISLFCLVIVTLSYATQCIPNFHLINMCNTICLTFLTGFLATRTPPPSSDTRASDASRTLSPSPPAHTPPSSPALHRCPLHLDVRSASPYGSRFRHGIHSPSSFLDLSSEESFQDSGLGLSVSSLGDVPSGDEEGGGAAQLIYPPEVPQTEPGVECSVVSGDQTSTFRDTPTPSLSSEASFPLLVPDSPGVDHEDEEYITLRVMELPRGPGTRRPAESHEDPITNLINRLAKLDLGSASSQPTAEMKKPQPDTQRTTSPTSVYNAERPYNPIPAVRTIPKLANCCKLTNRTFTPRSWEYHNFCYDCSTFRRFIRPMDEDSFFRSTRLAVDNLTHFRSSHYLLPNQPVNHHTLSNAFKPFGSAAERYFRSRLHNGVIVYESAFGVVDFSCEEEAHVAFCALQGRRIQGERAHWRLEFLDPEDATFGERLSIIHSEPPLELFRRLSLAAGEPERVDYTLRPPSPPVPARAFDTLMKRQKRQAGRSELRRPTMKLDEKRGAGMALMSAAKANAKLVQI